MSLRRALALLLVPPSLAVLMALAALAVAANLSEGADQAQSRLQTALDHRPSEPVVQAAELLVPGSTAGLAASSLQARILALVEGAEVQQIEARGAEAEGALTRMRVNLRLSGDEAAIMQAMIALEAAEPLIFVDGLKMSGPGDAGQLAVELDLSAYAGKVAP
jgi:predicted Zn-dependent protease